MRRLDLLTLSLYAPLTGVTSSGGAAPPDLSTLMRLATGWAWTAITIVEPDDGDKLAKAGELFADELARQVNSLEARAGVLGGFLNGPGVDAVEHLAILRAVEAGGKALHTLAQNVVQKVFTAARLRGDI